MRRARKAAINGDSCRWTLRVGPWYPRVRASRRNDRHDPYHWPYRRQTLSTVATLWRACSSVPGSRPGAAPTATRRRANGRPRRKMGIRLESTNRKSSLHRPAICRGQPSSAGRAPTHESAPRRGNAIGRRNARCRSSVRHDRGGTQFFAQPLPCPTHARQHRSQGNAECIGGFLVRQLTNDNQQQRFA